MFVYVNKYCNKILKLLTLNNDIKPLIKWGSDPVKRGRNGSGRSWCVAKDVRKDKLQSGLDYACGEGRADCRAIQPGATCSDSNTLEAHASFTFNSYYQKMERAASACDFDGAAYIITEQPSTFSFKLLACLINKRVK
ncbi:putative glucan endo-1,3-beta-D-glucosidase [Helianthus annuus]|nr:putative glucan endo-1,3-beta-D-glucosidase [Helianthus annuus]